MLKKAGEDQVTILAAVMSHFGMLSMFPLLLLVVTVAGYVFHDDDAAQQAIIDAAIENFPVLGDYLRASVQALPGSGVALLFGFVLLLWASLGFTKTAQVAMADVWGVPRRLRPGFWQLLGRSVWALGMLALPTALTATATVVSGELADSSPMSMVPGWVQATTGVAAAVLAGWSSLGVTFGSHLLAFRALTPKSVTTRELVPGTIVFSLFWTLLTAFGSVLISNRLVRANQLYGTIGFVIGLIFWIYLGAFGALAGDRAERGAGPSPVPAVVVRRAAHDDRPQGPPRAGPDRGALPGPGRRGALRGSADDDSFDPFDPSAGDEAPGDGVVDPSQRRDPERR